MQVVQIIGKRKVNGIDYYGKEWVFFVITDSRL